MPVQHYALLCTEAEVSCLNAGLLLKIQPQSTLQHPVSLCFLSPGIYSLYAYDVHQLSDHAKLSEEPTQQSADMPPHANSLGVTAVNAAYFLVE